MKGGLGHVGPCGKVTYVSRASAKAAHRWAGFRIKIYFCHECRGWHVCNAEKR